MTYTMQRVLIVDDEAMFRMTYITCLKQVEGISVVGEAIDGWQATLLCDELQPDVVIMDLIMPEMNGIEAARLIRASCPQIKIILLTAAPLNTQLRDHALDAGATFCVNKPLHCDILRQMVWPYPTARVWTTSRLN